MDAKKNQRRGSGFHEKLGKMRSIRRGMQLNLMSTRGEGTKRGTTINGGIFSIFKFRARKWRTMNACSFDDQISKKKMLALHWKNTCTMQKKRTRYGYYIFMVPFQNYKVKTGRKKSASPRKKSSVLVPQEFMDRGAVYKNREIHIHHLARRDKSLRHTMYLYVHSKDYNILFSVIYLKYRFI